MKKLLFGLIVSLAVPVYAGHITHSDYTAGSVITSAGQNTNENAIVNEFNGNIDDTNIKTGGVTTTNILNGTILAEDIANGTITETQISTTSSFSNLTISTLTSTRITVSTIVVNSSMTVSSMTVQFSSVAVSSVTGSLYSPWQTDWASILIPSGNFGTTTSTAAYCRRDGDTLQCKFSFKVGTVGASIGTLTLPSSLTRDNAKSLPGNRDNVGYFEATTNGGGNGVYADNIAGVITHVGASSTNTLYFYTHNGTDASGNNFASGDVNSYSNSNASYITGYFSVPITGWTTGR